LVVVVLTLVQTKQIINIQNTGNTSAHITKTPTHYKSHTYTHLHITKQVKQPQYKLKQTQYKIHPN